MGVALLLKSSADKKLRDASGRTALMLARERNHYGSHLAVLKAFGRRKPRKIASPEDAGAALKEVKPTLTLPAATQHATREACIQCDLEAYEGDEKEAEAPQADADGYGHG